MIKRFPLDIVLNALAELGIKGKATGRNDLVVETEDGRS